MDDAAPRAPADAAFAAPLTVIRPSGTTLATPVIFASPHSGRIYPASMLAASRLGPDAIRRSEDALVDRLIAAAPGFGHTLITAEIARAYLDVNREPWELDASMFEDELPAFARSRTARVAAGLGAIARIVCEGQEIYARKLTFADAEARVRRVHQPYHAALTALVADAKAAFGVCVLIDWHSMPAAAAPSGQGAIGYARASEAFDVVLGDRFGVACSAGLTRFVERHLGGLGYRVARNAPYAGGYTTEHYGRPGRKVHALQIELNRALYYDEASLSPTEGFARLQADLERFCAALAEADWRDI
ncbi:MAG TPA: N-formylglutamate amidohydrolase [Caulobacteraceae bacterium]|nr:N-formylglutamate amidohydrolase [Caulobacteraceae bacterium]